MSHRGKVDDFCHCAHFLIELLLDRHHKVHFLIGHRHCEVIVQLHNEQSVLLFQNLIETTICWPSLVPFSIIFLGFLIEGLEYTLRHDWISINEFYFVVSEFFNHNVIEIELHQLIVSLLNHLGN